jgi:large repetitive protein
VNLVASGGTSYLWSTGATTATLANVTTAGTYSVTVSNGNCTAIASQIVTVGNITATITPSASTALCSGSSVNLVASGGTSYLWSTGATTATLANVTTAGTYSVTVSNGNCTAIASKVVTIGNNITAIITPSSATTFCQGSSVDLTASGGTSYLWSTGSTGASIGNITLSGIYTVTVTSGACSATASTVVTVNKTPTVTITASGPTVFCAGRSVNLTASGGTTYAWGTGQTGAILSNITASATYTVTVTNSSGCTATASQTVSVIPIPTPSIIASGATTFCEGNSVTLTAYGGATYTWSNGATTPSAVISASGNYSVTVANGTCTATTEKIVTVLPAPTVTMTSTPSSGTSGTATATVTGGRPPYTFDWNNGATNYTLIGLRPGTYYLVVTDANVCTTEASVDVATTTPTADVASSFPVSISPIPNDGHFVLKLDVATEQNIQIALFNMIGKQVDKRAIFGKSIDATMDYSHLPNGQYLIKINTDIGTTTKWVIISK